MTGYGMVYGGETAPLMDRFGAGVAGALRENGKQMQCVAQILCEVVPMRKIAVPYLDLLELRVEEKAPFFGGRILFEAEGEQFVAAKALLQKNGLLKSRALSLEYAECADSEKMRKLLRGKRWSERRLELWSAFCGETEALGFLQYPLAAVQSVTAETMDRRAVSRAELAFGEIAMRLLKQAGGELLVCSGGAFAFRFGEAEPESIIAQMQQTFVQKMLPFCEDNAKMPKIRVINR